AARAAASSSATTTSSDGTAALTRAAHSRVFDSCGGSISKSGISGLSRPHARPHLVRRDEGLGFDDFRSFGVPGLRQLDQLRVVRLRLALVAGGLGRAGGAGEPVQAIGIRLLR